MIYRLTGMIARYARNYADWLDSSDAGYVAFTVAGLIGMFLAGLGWMEGRL